MHLVGDLLGYGRRTHPPAGPGRLGNDEAAVGAAFDDRITHVIPAPGHRAPVREDATGRLRPALDDVADKTPERQAIEILLRPVKVVHQGTERERAVRTAPGNDNVRTLGEGLGDG